MDEGEACLDDEGDGAAVVGGPEAEHDPLRDAAERAGDEGLVGAEGGRAALGDERAEARDDGVREALAPLEVRAELHHRREHVDRDAHDVRRPLGRPQLVQHRPQERPREFRRAQKE